MKADDVNRLEALVRNANPLPEADALIDSEESAAVTFRLIEATEKDVPGLLPAPPAIERRERGLTVETVQSSPARETRRPKSVRIAAIAFAAAVFVAAVISVGALVTRDSVGDVASPAPPDITFVDPEQQLFTHEMTIRNLIEDTYAQAEPLLDVHGVSFAVSLEIYGLPIPDYGVGWSMADDTTVVLAIDPYSPQLRDVLPERVPAMVADALFSVARERGGVSDETFFDSMVWSGLADHFAVELLGGPLPPWADAFPAGRTEELMERAQPLFDTRWDDEKNLALPAAERMAVAGIFNDWFIPDRPGSKWREQQGMDIPEWAGFTLGYRLIETYLAENPGQTAADLVNTPASVFRP
jgi:hypothetical protein